MDTLNELFSGFVAGVLGDEVAAEGFGEEGGGELVHLGLGFGVAGFDLVGEGEEGFDTADDFVLFGEGRNGGWKSLDVTDV